MILASCYTLGIQRFDLQGRNEGSYHLGGTVSHAIPDFPGRTIAAATLEGELAVMNSAGNVRWRTQLPRPIIALEMDPLGRYLIYGHATGEIVRLDLFGGGSNRPAVRNLRSPATAANTPARATTSSVRTPDWIIPVVENDQHAETAVIAIVDDPPLVALFTSPHRLQLFDLTGQALGQAPELTGVGRMLHTAPGWLAAATDRQILLSDLRHMTHRRPRCEPGPAYASGHSSRRFRPGLGTGTRSNRPADAGQPLGLEAGTPRADRGTGHRALWVRGGDAPTPATYWYSTPRVSRPAASPSSRATLPY